MISKSKSVGSWVAVESQMRMLQIRGENRDQRRATVVIRA